MIVTRGLTKRFGPVLAVDHVDLDVREGDRYGFLGPNGSGKTTVIRMLLGLVFATSGEIEVLGRPMPARVREVLPKVGALVEGPSSYGHLSGRANLALIDAAGRAGSRADRERRIEEALEQVGLAGIDGRSVRKYSLGMRQRLGLAAALLRGPRLLVLDEPANGLDPQGIREIRDLLVRLNEAGTTVFLSGHQLAEVEQLCTRVGVIDQGRLVLQAELAALQPVTGRVIVRSPDTDRAAAELDGQIASRDGERLVVTGVDPAELNTRLVSAGLRVTEIRPERRSLEDLVLELTGPGADRVDREPGQPGRQRNAEKVFGPAVRRCAMIRVELVKLVRRPRTWASILLLCALPTVVAVFIAVTHVAPAPGQGPALLSAVLSNGTLYPAAALALVLPIFLPIAVAIMAGDAIAGEATSGMLRYLLVRPVGRTRLLVAKLISVIAYVLGAVVLVAMTGYATGAGLFGTKPLLVTPHGLAAPGVATSLSGTPMTPADIAMRTLGAIAFIGVSMLGVAAIALFLSTLTDSSLGAALGALAALITSGVLVALNSAAAVSPYLPTRYWLAWADFFREPILWRNIERGFAIQGVYVVVFVAAAWANFASKDVTS